MQIIGDVIPAWEKNTRKLFNGPVPTIVFTPGIVDAEAYAAKFQAIGHRLSGHPLQDVLSRRRRRSSTPTCAVTAWGWCPARCWPVALTPPFTVTAAWSILYKLRKSMTMHIQMLGRVMRISEGKPYGLIIDHTEN